MIDLTGKIAFVTGGGRGIGAAIVRKLAQAGGAVVLHDIKTAGAATDVQKELGAERCYLVAGDLAQDAGVLEIWNQALAWRGKIDVLVNNAGIYESADVDHDFDAWSRSWHRTLQINLVAAGHL